MKLISFLLLLTIHSVWIQVDAQRAYDGECIVGYSPLLFNFNNDSIPQIIVPTNVTYEISFGASSIADENGKLAFYCTGNGVINRQGDTMDGVLLNYNLGFRKYFLWTGGYPTWTQQSIILSKANDEYYVFTYTMSDMAYDDWMSSIFYRMDYLTYHVVDMKANNGLGKVTKKIRYLCKTPC